MQPIREWLGGDTSAGRQDGRYGKLQKSLVHHLSSSHDVYKALKYIPQAVRTSVWTKQKRFLAGNITGWQHLVSHKHLFGCFQTYL